VIERLFVIGFIIARAAVIQAVIGLEIEKFVLNCGRSSTWDAALTGRNHGFPRAHDEQIHRDDGLV
jgi:hypothetical protein